MKALGPILIILIAALAVIGATYALSQTTAATALVTSSPGVGEAGDRPALSNFANGQSAPSGTPGIRPEGGSEGRGELQTLGQNLLKIAAVVAVVQVLWSSARWLKRAAASLTRKDRLSPSST